MLAIALARPDERLPHAQWLAQVGLERSTAAASHNNESVQGEMSKKASVIPARPEQRIVGLLRKAAEAQDDLAVTYRKMGWDLAAETADQEAAEFRCRAEKFAERDC